LKSFQLDLLLAGQFTILLADSRGVIGTASKQLAIKQNSLVQKQRAKALVADCPPFSFLRVTGVASLLAARSELAGE
jgi:hypothetical protein